MTEIMTPSKITDGQINKAVANYRALLEKHRSEMMSEPAQQVLGQSDLATEMLGVLRRRIEMVSTMFIRLVSGINRNQTPQNALDATNRKQYTTREGVVDTMPRGEGERVELKFFELDYDPTTTELDAEYKRRGLKADPFALCKHMQDDPAFADERPVACQWDLAGNGVACYATFNSWCGERSVTVDCNASDYLRKYRFAGVCLPADKEGK